MFNVSRACLYVPPSQPTDPWIAGTIIEKSTIEMALTHFSLPEKALCLDIQLGQLLSLPRAWGWHTAGLHAIHSRTRWQHSSAEQVCMATLLPTHLLAGFRASQGSPAPGHELLLPYRHSNGCPAPGAILMSGYTMVPACGLAVLFRKQRNSHNPPTFFSYTMSYR